MKPRHTMEVMEMHDAPRCGCERTGKGFAALERHGDEKIKVILRCAFAACVRTDDADCTDPMRLRERGD